MYENFRQFYCSNRISGTDCGWSYPGSSLSCDFLPQEKHNNNGSRVFYSIGIATEGCSRPPRYSDICRVGRWIEFATQVSSQTTEEQKVEETKPELATTTTVGTAREFSTTVTTKVKAPQVKVYDSEYSPRRRFRTVIKIVPAPSNDEHLEEKIDQGRMTNMVLVIGIILATIFVIIIIPLYFTGFGWDCQQYMGT